MNSFNIYFPYYSVDTLLPCTVWNFLFSCVLAPKLGYENGKRDYVLYFVLCNVSYTYVGKYLTKHID